MLEILEGLLCTAFILGGFLYIAYCLGAENEHNAKLDTEDRILHELTACCEDTKPVRYEGYNGYYRGYQCRMLIKTK